MLCVAGSILFAVSCVMQEIICKTFDCIEYLGMTGLYGACLCGIQMFLVEKQTLMNVDWSNTDILVYLAAFALLQFLFYSILPHILQNSGSTAVQLYLLTADFYTLVAGVMTNQYKVCICASKMYMRWIRLIKRVLVELEFNYHTITSPTIGFHLFFFFFCHISSFIPFIYSHFC